MIAHDSNSRILGKHLLRNTNILLYSRMLFAIKLQIKVLQQTRCTKTASFRTISLHVVNKSISAIFLVLVVVTKLCFVHAI